MTRAYLRISTVAAVLCLLAAGACDKAADTPAESETPAADKVAKKAEVPPTAKAPGKPMMPKMPKLEMPDRDAKLVVADVDGRPIYSGTYDRMVAMRRLRMSRFPGGAASKAPDAEKRIKDEALNYLIEEQLWVGAALADGVKITDGEAKQAVQEYFKRFPGEEQKRSWMEQYKLDEATMQDDFRRKKLADAARRKVVESVKMTDDQLKQEFKANPGAHDEVQARHVLVKFPANADEATKKAARDKIDAARKRIAGGEDFAKVAKEISDCPSGKRAGGDLGFFGRKRMVPEFDKAAFALKKGKLSDVVETKFGYHIIRVENVKKNFDEVKQTIERKLSGPAQKQAIDAKMKELREKAKITKNGQYL